MLKGNLKEGVSAQGEQQRGPRVLKTEGSGFREAKVTGSKARQSKEVPTKRGDGCRKPKTAKEDVGWTQKAGEMKGKPRGRLFLGLLGFLINLQTIYTVEGPVM